MFEFSSGARRLLACAALICACAGFSVAGERGGPITSEGAKEIALAQTGGGDVVSVNRQRGPYGRFYFYMEIAKDDGWYHVQIDADTGEIFKLIQKGGRKGYRNRGPAVSNPTDAPQEAISFEQARAIALERTGGGTVVESDMDVKRNGRVEYEFEIINDGVKYEIEMDGFGNFKEFEQEGRRRSASNRPREQGAPAAPRAPAPSRAQPAAPGAARPADGMKMMMESAKAVALGVVGGGDVTEYRLTTPNGKFVHEFSIRKDDKRYDIKIDDDTGALIEMLVKDVA